MRMQLTEFSVPSKKYSLRPRQGFLIMFGGMTKLSGRESVRSIVIILFQIGAAPVSRSLTAGSVRL